MNKNNEAYPTPKEVNIVEIFKARVLLLRANKILKDLTKDCPALCFCVLCTVRYDNESNFDKLNITGDIK